MLRAVKVVCFDAALQGLILNSLAGNAKLQANACEVRKSRERPQVQLRFPQIGERIERRIDPFGRSPAVGHRTVDGGTKLRILPP